MLMICKRVRLNNGVVEALFSAPNSNGAEDYVIVNVQKLDPVQFEKGQEWEIEFRKKLN